MRYLSMTNMASILGGDLHLIGEDQEIEGVVTDNRNVKEGFLFIPLKGQRVDGHEFINDAYSRGAICTLSEIEQVEPKGSYIKVNSTEDALKRLATYYRTKLFIPIIGVIGSVGKTSTKEMISAVLSQRFNVLYTEGNYNNEIGLPLTLLRIKDEHDVAVCEMGISEFGEMSRLGAIAQPDMIVFTNVKECHLEFLGDRDGVLKAKSEVFEHLLSQGIVYLNTDDDKLESIESIPDAKIITFGTANQNVAAYDIEDRGLDGILTNIKTEYFDTRVHIHIPGRHNIYHALAATAVGIQMGLTMEEIVTGIETVKSIGGRNNIISLNEKINIIDDCYNASPASVKAALSLLSKSPGKKIAVLGDMAELGEEGKELHYNIGCEKSFENIDMLFIFGDLSKEIKRAVEDNGYSCIVYSFDSKEDMIKKIETEVFSNELTEQTILIKASHSSGYSSVVDALLAYRK